MLLDLKDIKLLEKIGEESFKERLEESECVSHTAVREVMLLRELSHPNIVKLEGISCNYQEGTFQLVFPYMDYDLYDIIRYHNVNLQSRPFKEYTIKSILWQVLRALEYLHQTSCIHRDLKPSNILVQNSPSRKKAIRNAHPNSNKAIAHSTPIPQNTQQNLMQTLIKTHPAPVNKSKLQEQDVEENLNKDDLYSIKLADFGLARIIEQPIVPMHYNGVVVTIWYRAPELLYGAKHYGYQVDIWSLGCITAELLLLRPLFQGQVWAYSLLQQESIKKIKACIFGYSEIVSAHAIQTGQLQKIFSIMGIPFKDSWPLADCHPNYKQVEDYFKEHPPVKKAGSIREHIQKFSHTKSFNPLLIDLIEQMLQFDPKKRITASQALSHKYFEVDPKPGIDVLKEEQIVYPQRPQAVNASN